MKTNLQLFIQGKEVTIPIQLNADQLNEISLALSSEEKYTGWERPVDGAPCYYEDALGRTQKLTMDNNSAAQIDLLYANANCYLSEALANDMARADNLLKKIRREAILDRKAEINFSNDNDGGGYTIGYNYSVNNLEIGFTGQSQFLGDIVFASEEAAQKVMNAYADELLWYFTHRKELV